VERPLKERLVGAAVLMAMAVILIPEMLSGPRRAPAPAAKQDEGNLKRYTIDLQASTPAAQSPATPTVIEEPAPPPEEAPAAGSETAGSTAMAPASELLEQQGEQREAEPAAPATPPGLDQPPTRQEPVPIAVPAADTPTRPAESESAVPPLTAAGRWAVQLIAYDKREQAQRMAEDLRSSNIAAFVMPVQTKAGTLYRVRVGPFTARPEAEDALRKLKAVSSGATIVAQP
jgi:DedD protein